MTALKKKCTIARIETTGLRFQTIEIAAQKNIIVSVSIQIIYDARINGTQLSFQRKSCILKCPLPSFRNMAVLVSFTVNTVASFSSSEL